MVVAAEKFLRLKGELPHLVIGEGPELYYRQRLKEYMKERLFPAISESERSVTTFSGKFSLSDLTEAVNTYSIFQSVNFVLIEEPRLLSTGKDTPSDTQKKDLAQFGAILSNIPDTAYVLILCEKLDKRKKFYKDVVPLATLVDCASVRLNALGPWLVAQAGLFGARLEEEAIALIEEYMSIADTVPLGILSQELEKLSLYAAPRTTWTAQDVETIFAALPEAGAFALSNAMQQGNLVKCLELLALEVRKGTAFPLLVGMLASTLRRLARYAEKRRVAGLSSAECVKALGIHPFVGKNLEADYRRFSLRSLHKALRDMDELSLTFRLGGRKFSRLEEILVELAPKSGKI